MEALYSYQNQLIATTEFLFRPPLSDEIECVVCFVTGLCITNTKCLVLLIQSCYLCTKSPI